MIREKKKMLSGIEIFKFLVSDHLKENSLIGLCGIAEKSSNQWNATILHGINLGDQRP